MNRAVQSIVVAVGIFFPVAQQLAWSAEVDVQDFLTLKQRVDADQETIASLKTRLAAAESSLQEARREIRNLKDIHTALTKDLVTQEQLRALAGKMEQVDTSRANDSKRLFEALKKIVEAPPVAPISAPPISRPSRPSPEILDPGPKTNRQPVKPSIDLPPESYLHIVKPNETLGEILMAYRKEYGLKTTMAQVEAANPGINPNRLKVDQKINIPVVR